MSDVRGSLQAHNIMDKESQTKNPQTQSRNISVGLVFSWVFSIIFIIDLVVNLLSKPLLSLTYLFMVLVIFPPFNKFVEKKWNFHFSKGMKILLIFIGLCAIGLVAMKQKYAKNTPTVQVSVQDLSNQYDINEIKADELYKSKLLEVSGAVTQVTKNSILIKEVEATTFIKCELTDESEKLKASTLEKNNTVTLKGFNSGKSRNEIILKHCEIINITRTENVLSQKFSTQ